MYYLVGMLVFQVELRGGVLQPVMVEQPPLTLDPPSSSSSSSVDVDWMTYIRPARDRHEQNVELVLDLHQRAGLRSVIYSLHLHGFASRPLVTIGRNRSCGASDSAYCYTFLRSVVCLSSVTTKHSCTLLKPFDGFRCHSAGTLVGSSDTLC